MRARTRQAGIVVTVSALTLSLAGTATAGPRPAAAGAAATSTSTRLITGDTILRRTSGGHTSVSIAPRAGSSSSFSEVRLGTGNYVFPAAARYYLPTVLDPALFDVSRPAATSIPVDVAFTGARPSVPGLTVTSSTSTSLHGYVSQAGTGAFGSALTAQWHHDVRAGLAAPKTLFGASRIAFSAAPVVTPAFQQVTLVISATGRDGQKLPFGFFGLVNTDDARRFVGFVQVVNGTGRASVPIGNYSLIGDDTTFDPSTFSPDTAIKTIPDFSVTTNFQHVRVDFSSATVHPTMRTPQPAALEQLTLEWDRLVPNGGIGFSYGFGPDASVEVAPAPAPVHGTVDWLTTWQLTGTPARGNPYRYDATYDDSGAIPADQSRVFDLAQAGRSDTNFYADGFRRDTAFGRGALYPFQGGIFTFIYPSTAPLARTDYFIAPPDAMWADVYIAAPTFDDPFQGFVSDELRTYPPGTTQHIDWMRGPLAPGVPETTDPSQFFFCSGCRTTNSFALFLAPFVDATPGHAGSIDAVDPSFSVASFTLYRDGHKIVSQQNSTGAVVRVPETTATYRAVVETDLGSVGFFRSTHAVTELTFVSAAGQGPPLPPNGFCPVRGTDCRLLPLLAATVPLPTDLLGTMPLGSTSFVFTIHGASPGPALTVPTAQLSISLDGGSTFRSVPVTPLGGGRFRATITHTAADAGHLVTVQVSGQDAVGGSITETVDNAYAVANS